MAATSAISMLDLSQLPAPDAIDPLDFEAIFAAMLADLSERDPTFDALVESEPAYKVLQAAAFAVLGERAKRNDTVRAVMLAFARGSDLDHLAARKGVVRQIIDPGAPDALPPIPPTYESDDDLRKRTQLAPEGYTTAGSEGSYLFHGLSADPQVKDIQATSPRPDDIRAVVLDVLADNGAAPGLVTAMTTALDNATWPGTVEVFVLSREGDGTADADLLEAVDGVLSADTIRPLTDHVVVSSADVTGYTVDMQLVILPGPDAEVVRAAAQVAVDAYCAWAHRLGFDVTRAGLIGAGMRPGVQNVILPQPAADLIAGNGQAYFPTDISVTVAGTDV